jgi:hypothetical protein
MTKDLVSDAYCILNDAEFDLFGNDKVKGYIDFVRDGEEIIPLLAIFAKKSAYDLGVELHSLPDESFNTVIDYDATDKEIAFALWSISKKAIWDAWDKKMLEGE